MEADVLSNREREEGPIPKRHQRLYKQGNSWYVATREAPIGPFSEVREAIRVSRDYVEYLRHAPSLEEVVRAG